MSADDDNFIAVSQAQSLVIALDNMRKLWLDQTLGVDEKRYGAIRNLLFQVSDPEIYGFLADVSQENWEQIHRAVQDMVYPAPHGFIQWEETGGESVHEILYDAYDGIADDPNGAALATKRAATLFVLTDIAAEIAGEGISFFGSAVARRVPSPVVASLAVFVQQVFRTLMDSETTSAIGGTMIRVVEGRLAIYNQAAYSRVVLAPVLSYNVYSEEEFLTKAEKTPAVVSVRDTALGPWAQDEESSSLYQAGKRLLSSREREVSAATRAILRVNAGREAAFKSTLWKERAPVAESITSSPSRLREKGRNDLFPDDPDGPAPSSSSTVNEEIIAAAVDGLRSTLNGTVQSRTWTFSQQLDRMSSASYNLDVCSSQLVGF